VETEYFKYLIVFILVLMSALFSGLTLGTFSLSIESLSTKTATGDRRASKILKVRHNSYLLLCTLLFGNVIVNTSISIIMGSITSGLYAGIIATSMIFLFGEIFPQAAFSRHALSFSSNFIWFIKITTIILYPVTKPVSLSLKFILGEAELSPISKLEMSEIIRRQEDHPESTIDADEERIILGALSFSDIKAIDVATPATVAYYLNKDTEIKQSLVEEIYNKGFSRIPIYDGTPDNIISVLYVKDLITIDWRVTPYRVGQLARTNKLFTVDENIQLDSLFNQLIKRKIHLALLFDEFGVFSGIVTLEDIVEEILKIEIVDEQDEHIDMRKFALIKSKQRHKRLD